LKGAIVPQGFAVAALRALRQDRPMTDALAGARRRLPTNAWLRRGVIAVAALLLLWAVAWLAVPPVLKGQAEQRLSAWLGRPVSIGRVDFAPWSLTLTLEQFRIGAADAAQPPQLEVARVMVNAELRSLLRLAPVVQAIEVDAPRLRLAHVAAGRYDIDDMLARLRPADSKPPDDRPARFALYNLKLSGGELLFDDRPVQRQHRVEGLQLTLPFLSNLPADIDVQVEPRLAFRLNGAAFDSGAQAQPFAKDRNATLKLTIANLDLASWLAYVPAGMPIRPARGVFASDLEIQFSLAADGAPRLAVTGQASLGNAALLAGSSSEPAIAWQRLAVGLQDVQPLARRIGLGTVRLDGLHVQARRSADGAINLLSKGGTGARPSAPKEPGAPAAAAEAAWQLRLDKLELAGARVDWHDDTTRPAAAVRIDALDAAVGPLRWPFETAAGAAPLQMQARIAPAEGAASAAAFSLQGQASDRAAQATISLDGFDLRWLAPYLAGTLEPAVEGRLQLKTEVNWAAGDTPQLALSALGAQLDGLRIVERGAARNAAPAVSIATVSVSDTQLDLVARKVTVGGVKVDRPTLRFARDRQGRINALTWPRRQAASGATPAGGSPPWQLLVNQAHLSAGDLSWTDELPAAGASETVRLRASALNASVRGFAWPGAAGTAPARTQLSLRLTDGATASRGAAANAGRVEWNGQFAAAPLSARGTLRAERLPAHALSPYVDSGLPIDLLRAEASWRGELAFAQRGEAIEASAKGDALIGDLRVHERPGAGGARGGDELLSWQSFALSGLQFRMAPGSKPSLAIGEAALTDFYSRLVITEDGRFNLRDVAAAPKATDATASAPAPASAAPASAPAAPAGLPIDISVGGVRLANGKVDFTDRFIRPNYSAALTELNGRLGAFSSSSRDMATLELRGRAAGTALLEVAGALNPTARPLALDIRAKATDLELAPFSPYSGRYAGYAIERGKLSMDVAYKIDADGKLEARNQVILNQLTFGDKVESPDATKLPVLLAVALLKDRNGVIDINLPISGSINDPQFSVFGIVLKIIGNLLIKALTAPFALLAGGGSDDLSYVAFEPGTARISESGRGVIDKVAKALTDRPALRMTVAGASDPQSERDAMQRAALEARIAAEQRREALRSGAAADAPLPALTPMQRETIVKRIYSDARLPNKPRNVLGLAKDIPLAEMEALLRAGTLITTDTARELALQRGLAVRDALVAKGLPSERLFLAAPRLRASGEDDAAWSPRVQLTLSTN
jgi:uncharacterized protein involved in outer membrane biogenesis